MQGLHSAAEAQSEYPSRCIEIPDAERLVFAPDANANRAPGAGGRGGGHLREGDVRVRDLEMPFVKERRRGTTDAKS